MKIKSFGWLLLALSASMQAGADHESLIVSFAQNGAHLYATNEGYKQSLPNEKNFRKRLYWLDKHNPRYFLLDSFQDDFDYYIAILTDHIAVLENKIAQQKSKFTSTAMFKTVGFSALSALCGTGSYYSYATKRHNFWFCKQEAVNTAVSLGLMTAMFGAVAGIEFYKVLHYTERLAERLARDKRILEDLQREKAAKKLKDMMSAAK